MTRSCSNCAFAGRGEDVVGRPATVCRRTAAAPWIDTGFALNPRLRWPVVQADDWCGDWRAPTLRWFEHVAAWLDAMRSRRS